MKKKLLVLVALLLCVVTVLSACGGAVRFKKIVADDFADKNQTYTAAEIVNLTGSMQVRKGDLVYFSGANDGGEVVHTVYNLVLNKSVFTATASSSTSYAVELKSGYYDNVAWFVVTKTVDGDPDDTVTKEIYNQEGAQILTFNTEDSSMRSMLDLIIVDTAVYRIDDEGAIEHEFDLSPFVDVPSLMVKAGKYYLSGSEDGKTINCYDDELQLTYHYEAPAFAEEYTAIMLNNGNVLVQYKTYAAFDAKKYDYLDDGTKVLLTSQLINAKNGKIKNLNLDFIILFGGSRALGTNTFVDFDSLDEKVENVAFVSYIEDQLVAGMSSFDPAHDDMEDVYENVNTRILSLSNKGGVKGVLNATVSGQLGLPYQLSEDRWVIESADGEEYLVNQKGKILTQISNVSGGNGAYLACDGKLYDTEELTEVYDYAENDLTMYSAGRPYTQRGIFFENEAGAILLYAEGQLKTIIEASSDDQLLKVDSAYFVVKAGDSYNIYNDVGSLLCTVSNASGNVQTSVMASDYSLVLFGLKSDGKNIMVRLTGETK